MLSNSYQAPSVMIDKTLEKSRHSPHRKYNGYVLEGRKAELQHPKQLIDISKNPIPTLSSSCKYDLDREHAYIMAQALRSYTEHTSKQDEETEGSNCLMGYQHNHYVNPQENKNLYLEEQDMNALKNDGELPRRIRSKSAGEPPSFSKDHQRLHYYEREQRTVQSARTQRSKGKLYNHSQLRSHQTIKRTNPNNLSDLKIQASNAGLPRKLNFTQMNLPSELNCSGSQRSKLNAIIPQSKSTIYEQHMPNEEKRYVHKRSRLFGQRHPNWVASNLSISRLNLGERMDSTRSNDSELSPNKDAKVMSYKICLPKDEQNGPSTNKHLNMCINSSNKQTYISKTNIIPHVQALIKPMHRQVTTVQHYRTKHKSNRIAWEEKK